MQFYVRKISKHLGPFEETEILEMVRIGELSRNDFMYQHSEREEVRISSYFAEKETISDSPVEISYDVYWGGAFEKRELPFLVGVMGNFVGKPKELLPPLQYREFIEINSESFDDVLSVFSPRLNFKVADKLQNNGSEIEVELNFKSLSDFNADNIAQMVEPLRQLIEQRKSHIDKKLVDDKLSVQLNEIMHHADFKTLESAWRGLNYLVSNTKCSHRLKIKVIHVTLKEFHKNFERSVEIYATGLFRWIHGNMFDCYASEPFGCLIGNYEFANHYLDITVLENIARIAEMVHIPFISGVSPDMFGDEYFWELEVKRSVIKSLDRIEFLRWHKFRESEEAKYVSLCLPHFLLRQNYGDKNLETKLFNFTEEINEIADYLWGNAAFAFGTLITKAFAQHSWCAQIDGGHFGLIENLPVAKKRINNKYGIDHSQIDVILNEYRNRELSNESFNIISVGEKEGEALFLEANSCTKLKSEKYHPSKIDPVDTELQKLTSLPVTFAISRFIHHLKVIIRHNIVCNQNNPKVITSKNLEKILNDWVRNYCLAEGEICSPKKPLAEAEIKVTQDVEKGVGHFICEVYLKPCYQLPLLKQGRRILLKDNLKTLDTSII